MIKFLPLSLIILVFTAVCSEQSLLLLELEPIDLEPELVSIPSIKTAFAVGSFIPIFNLELHVKPSLILSQNAPCPQNTTSPCILLVPSLDSALEIIANRSYLSYNQFNPPQTLNATILLGCLESPHKVTKALNITQDITMFHYSIFTITSSFCDRAMIELSANGRIEISSQQIELKNLSMFVQNPQENQSYTFITLHDQSEALKIVLTDVDVTGFSYKSTLFALFALEDSRMSIINTTLSNIGCVNSILFLRPNKGSVTDPALLFEDTTISNSTYINSYFLWTDNPAENTTIKTFRPDKVNINSESQQIALQEMSGFIVYGYILEMSGFNMTSSNVTACNILQQQKFLDQNEIPRGVIVLKETNITSSTFSSGAMMINIPRAEQVTIEYFYLIRCITTNVIIEIKTSSNNCSRYEGSQLKLRNFLVKDNTLKDFIRFTMACDRSLDLNLTSWGNTLGNLIDVSYSTYATNLNYVLSGIYSIQDNLTFGSLVNLNFANYIYIELRDIQAQYSQFWSSIGVDVRTGSQFPHFKLDGLYLHGSFIRGWMHAFVYSINGLESLTINNCYISNNTALFHSYLFDVSASDISLSNIVFSKNLLYEPAIVFKWGTLYCTNLTVYGHGQSFENFYTTDSNEKYGTIISMTSFQSVTFKDLKLVDSFFRNTQALLIEGLRTLGNITFPPLLIENAEFYNNQILSESEKASLIECNTYERANITFKNVKAINNTVESVVSNIDNSALFAISAGNSSFNAINIDITNNFGSGISNGLYVRTQNASIQNSSFTRNGYFQPQSLFSNQSKSWGSPLILDSIFLIITNCIFERNKAKHGAGVLVGLSTAYSMQIYERTAKISTVIMLINNTFFNNYATEDGAAVYIGSIARSPSVIIKNNSFTENTADGSGGAIFFDKGFNVSSPTILDGNFFLNNKAWIAGRDIMVASVLSSIHTESKIEAIKPSFILINNSFFTADNYSKVDLASLCNPSLSISSTGGPIWVINSTFMFSLAATILCSPSSPNAMFISTKSKMLIAIEGTNFTTDNKQVRGSGYLAGIVAIEQTQVLVNNSQLLNYTVDSPILQLINSNCTIQNTNFNDIILSRGSPQGQAVILVSGQNASLHCSKCKFHRIKGAAIIAELGSKLILDSRSEFTNISSGEESSVSILSNAVAHIRNLIFINVSTEAQGGSISLVEGSLDVSSTLFLNSNARDAGGAIYFQGQSPSNSRMESSTSNNLIRITDCIFLNNNLTGSDSFTAGGAVYIEIAKDALPSCTIIENNTFSGNQALIGGGGALYIKYSDSLTKSSPLYECISRFALVNEFHNNLALYGSDYSTNPFTGILTIVNASNVTDIKFTCSNATCKFSENITATSFHGYLLNITFLDLYGNRILSEHSGHNEKETDHLEYLLTLEITRQLKQNYGSYCKFSSCIVSGNDILIKGFENETIDLKFTVTGLNNPPFVTILRTIIRPCKRGEINTGSNGSLICTACKPGSYSFYPEQESCHDCPPPGICPGGDRIIVPENYWRPTYFSTDLYFVGDNCNNTGSYGDELCQNGYQGPFCSGCDLNHAPSSSGSCRECPPLLKGIMALAFWQLLSFFYVCYCISTFRKNNNDLANQRNQNTAENLEKKISRGGYTTIITEYLQIISILRTYSVLISGFIAFFEIFANPGKTLFYSLDCVLLKLGVSIQEVYYHKIFLILVLPFAEFIVLAFYGLLRKFACRNNDYHLFSFLLIAAQVVIVVEQPSVLFNLTSYFNCHSYDPLASKDGDNTIPYYLKSAPNSDCYTSLYLKYRSHYVIPSLILWAGVFPLLLYLILRCIKNKFEEPKTKETFGSLYAIYEKRYYYWIIVQMVQKFVLVLCVQLSFLPTKAVGLTLFMELMGYEFLVMKCKPYKYRDLNKTDITANFVFISTIFMMVYGEGDVTLEKIAVCIILLINTIFILYIFFKAANVWDLEKKFAVLIMCIFSLISKCSCLFRSGQEDTDIAISWDLNTEDIEGSNF